MPYETFTSDTSEDVDMEAPVDSSRPKMHMPELTLQNAQKILQFYQNEPQWLANPRTRHAASSDFAQASKIIGINMQIERLNAQAEAARGKNTTSQRVGQSLLKLAEGGGTGAKWASQWYAQGEDGKPRYENPTNWASILEGYEQHATSKDGVDPTDAQLLDIAERARKSGDTKKAEMLEAVVAEHGRNKGQPQKIERSVSVKADDESGATITRQMTEEEFAKSQANKPLVLDLETKQQLSTYAEEKAALSTGDKSKGPDWLGLSNRARNLAELETKLKQKGINPDTATRLSPAATAPEKVRVKGPNGQTGTVPKGAALPEGWTLE